MDIGTSVEFEGNSGIIIEGGNQIAHHWLDETRSCYIVMGTVISSGNGNPWDRELVC